jgi:glycosyltransferase involved in cell wall biosynthesis
MPVHIVNLSDMEPTWSWLKTSFSHRPELVWDHVSTQSSTLPIGIPKRAAMARACAALRARRLLESGGQPLLVSHGPRLTMFGPMARGRHAIETPHLAFAFNFTDLPTGLTRFTMSRAFEQVSEFTVFSNVERELYAAYFGLPIERFMMRHWAVGPPNVGTPGVPRIAGNYICALGTQARDYRVLLDSMRRLPTVRLVVVTNPESVAGLEIPSNVQIFSRVPLPEAMNILAHSRLMVLPLRDSAVPCGHVTIVSAMHLGKPCIVTDSQGISDYVQSGVNGLTVPARDMRALIAAIEELYDSEALRTTYGNAARMFATEHCSESNAVLDFQESMDRLLPRLK